MKISASLLILWSLCLCVHAQKPEEPSTPLPVGTATLSVKVRLEEFDALVRNQQGELVRHLTRNDLAVTEDDKRQTIRYFTEDDDLPLTIGLLVDTSASQLPFVDDEKIASQKFLTDMLTMPQDNAFLIRFDTAVLLLRKMTHDLPDLESGLNLLYVAHPPRRGPRGSTLLYDAICSAATVAFPSDATAQHGRRALVILTDGDDEGSTHTADNAVQCAQLANITVYTVFYSTNDPGPRRTDNPNWPLQPGTRLSDRSVMARMSTMTGGRLFAVSRSLPIDSVYALIQNDLRHQYRVGYTPPPSAAYVYHKLELKPLDSKLKVQARFGYFTPR